MIEVKNFRAPQFQIFCDTLELVDSEDEAALEQVNLMLSFAIIVPCCFSDIAYCGQFATIEAIQAVLPVAVH